MNRNRVEVEAWVAMFREVGLSDAEMKRWHRIFEERHPDGHRSFLESKRHRSVRVLEDRLAAIGEEILTLRGQQRLLAGMLRRLGAKRGAGAIDKAMWVDMLRAAGMDEEGMQRWHAELERRAPQAHAELLRALGIAGQEAEAIRAWARRGGTARRRTVSAAKRKEKRA